MSASEKEIKGWIEEAQRQKSSHLLIITDTFDYDNYPVFAHGKKDCMKKIEEYNDINMQKVEEVYNMRRSIKKQFKENRSWNI
ncbi:hypothetical protein LCGC14_1315970 [marine sediment metagenome]|uniref:Uncharacterized protein n=1 Tax=marine sediment metagenome TaxID=412755 RepID=A0A0F9KL21_9ZZZZ